VGATVSGLAGCVLAGPQAAAAPGSRVLPEQAGAQVLAARTGTHDQRDAMQCRQGWRLSVPSIGVNAPVIKLGGPRSGDIAVPTFAQVWDVGWYRFGAVPGRPGDAVFLGHVDTYRGPAVFYHLYALHRGALIEANLGCGHVQRFYVRWVEEVSKNRFPSREVFGRTGRAKLWLITCGGQFDYATRHYLSNIIVYATK
jgi:sortase (surface protein transpeptidase)